jgi:hypothetical protein
MINNSIQKIHDKTIHTPISASIYKDLNLNCFLNYVSNFNWYSN